MSPVPLPVTNSATKTQTTKVAAATTSSSTLKAKTTTTNMANSNTTTTQYKQQMEQNNNNHHASSVGAVSTANKKKNINIKTKELTSSSASSTSSSSSSSSFSSSSRTSLKNVITSQCDSSSSTSDNIKVKHETNQSCNTVIKTELESADQSNETALADGSDLQLSSMRQRPILLSAVNPHIICGLCFGYLIDATTIVECLHSFCHSCLIKHLRTEQYCPRCEMMINTAKPNIKPDTTLQAIVYKLVPGLYEKELMRKRAFYKDRPEEAALATPEQRGDDTEHLIFSPSDYMSISLEYADIDELVKSNDEYNELLKPRYLQCPAMCTVAHLKKLVYGKFEINSNRFTIDIMYKVKTIVLLDHYTLMDVAYIYTWKRDAPMRFYFRVKQSLKPLIRVKKNLIPQPKKEVTPAPVEEPKLLSQAMVIVHEPSPSIVEPEKKVETCPAILEPTEIKQENESEVSSTTEIVLPEPKQFEIVPPQTPSLNSPETSLTDKLKITLVNKAVKDKLSHNDVNSPARVKVVKEKKERESKTSPSTSTPKDERKVENIKLKIDLSKQNSVTIINMSDPERKEIVKPVKPEKEWKVKTKKDKDGSPKSSPKSSPHSERKSKTPSPLTVPPLTIKAVPPLSVKPAADNAEDDKKSQFLKSFALAPIKSIKTEKSETKSSKHTAKEFTHSIVNKSVGKDLSLSSSSKRKSKEPIKAVVKKPKLSPPLATEDFKIKLPLIPNAKPATPSSNAANNSISSKPLMPPPAPLTSMKPPSALNKKSHKLQQSKIPAAPPGSLTPHPMHGVNEGIQLAAPGSRTPIAKRFQPILPKASRVNPFANIPSDVNKLLKDAGTEIKSIPNEPVTPKVYGPKIDNAPLMGPPSLPNASKAQTTTTTTMSSRNSNNSTSKSGAASNKNNSYLNLALFNASKSKGNEVPPGCRTPMYTPNSPIYSPSSPQYVPNYNIPTMPTYKYTPKPNNTNNSYLQSVLGSSNQMSGLFPSPPVKKDANTPTNNNNSYASSSNNTSSNNTTTNRNDQPNNKRVYVRSPSPIEDPPEKQLKVKSLLNSCNINIPSSLSITITREDGESSSNGQTYPKHKSPVNNYIEILKLPDQPAENTENKRLSPPMQMTNNSLFPNPPVKRVATPPLNAPKNMNNHAKQQPTNNNNNNQKSQLATNQNATNLKTGLNNMAGNLNMMSKGNNNGNNGNNKSPAVNNNNKPQSCNKSPVNPADKKTPSPEKRLHSSTTEQKSPKSPNGDNSASKKFRHILPRQMSNPQPEVNIPKPPNNGNIIGTYSSPNGVNVKIHSNKKVQPSKKSPGAQNSMGTNKQLQQPPVQSPHNGMKSSTKSPQTSKANNKSNQNQAQIHPPALSTNSPVNKMPTTPPTLPTLPPGLTHPMQAMLPPHLGAAAAAACQNVPGQAELSKFLKENLLRAQVQAAVANQSNMFYPYAANAAAAAQLGQFNPTMYNYQQAYIMDQLSRMQRAGNEAFSEYMQKLKNSMEANKSPAELTQQTKPMQNAKNLSSPKSLTNTNNNPPATSSSASSSTALPLTPHSTHPMMKDQQTAKTK